MIIAIIFVGCGTAGPEEFDGGFWDSEIPDQATDFPVDVLDAGTTDTGIDLGRGTSNYGGPCSVDSDCASAHHVCNLSTCTTRTNFEPCDVWVTGDDTERLCGTLGSSHVYPVEDNSDPNVSSPHWRWCLPSGNPLIPRCVPNSIQQPTCLQDSDCAGHYQNPSCYFNTCRTLNCPTPLETTGCQAGEICSGLRLCVPME